jgi:hypothetical protein
MPEKTRVLITVKTYPLPSEAHMELVCTAGVLDDGTYIRIYPVNYRYRPYAQWYSKYQWVEATLEKNLDDPRPESYRPVQNTPITPLGKRLDTKKDWAERRKYVLARPARTMCELNATKQDEVSLGIVHVRQATDFVAEPCEADWKPKWKALFRQQLLFGPQRRPLEKVPYKFSYRYLCDNPDCNGHQMQIEDWEVYELFRKMRDKFCSADIAVEKVRARFFDQMCAADKDTHFYVGTVKRFGTWIVLGVFWPKRSKKH